MAIPALVRTALLGAAIGSRTQLPAVILAYELKRGRPAPGGISVGGRGAKLLSRSTARTSLVAGALTELIADKLPRTPSRLTFGGLALRGVQGATGGSVVAARSGESQRTHAVVGVAAALASAYAGAHLRRQLAQWFGRDWPGAVFEDALSAGLAATAVHDV
jgi:uncharacterized membrane protein